MQLSSSQSAAQVTAAPKRKQAHLRHSLQGISSVFTSIAPPIGYAACMFLFPFVNWFAIPSPFAPAYLLSREEKPSIFALIGLGASLLLRIFYGIDLDLWQFFGCGLLWLIMQRYQPKTTVETAALAGMAMMPRVIIALVQVEAVDIVFGCAAVPIAMLSAIYMQYGQRAIASRAPQIRPRERASVMLFCLLIVSGLGYFRIATISLGQVAAVVCTIAIANTGGCTFGVASGLLCGLALALCGHDCRIALSLAICGLCCGIPYFYKKKWFCLPAALVGNVFAFFITPLTYPTLSYLTVGIGCIVYFLFPARIVERIHAYTTGTIMQMRSMDTSFMTHRIARMQSAIEKLAIALPQRTDQHLSDGAELGSMLCAHCSNHEQCWGRSRARTEKMLTMVMAMSKSGNEVNEDQLPLLAEHGCLRADVIPTLVMDAQIMQQKRRAACTKAQFEHELTIAHLAAMSDSLGDLGVLAAGESLNDLNASHLISLAIEELNVPLKLSYARRVDGHLQVALETESMLPIQRPLDMLMKYLTKEMNLPLSVSNARKGYIELEETPLYSAEIGTASLCAGQRLDSDSTAVCGDSSIAKRCEGGRLLMMLSDGMGHGELAREQSEKTLELLLLLLEAGYSRKQAITAVNGIMLNAQDGERFSTVDIADVDLWTGDVYSEKLGACASWLIRGNHMKKIDTSSLPLGIMEEAASTTVQYRLHSGDILILMSDGVSDVFNDDDEMKIILEESLYIQPQRMADAILRNALLVTDGPPKDDMSVMVMLLIDRKRGGGEEEIA